jgi:hypothetical protein
MEHALPNILVAIFQALWRAILRVAVASTHPRKDMNPDFSSRSTLCRCTPSLVVTIELKIFERTPWSAIGRQFLGESSRHSSGAVLAWLCASPGYQSQAPTSVRTHDQLFWNIQTAFVFSITDRSLRCVLTVCVQKKKKYYFLFPLLLPVSATKKSELLYQPYLSYEYRHDTILRKCNTI